MAAPAPMGALKPAAAPVWEAEADAPVAEPVAEEAREAVPVVIAVPDDVEPEADVDMVERVEAADEADAAEAELKLDER